jgi:hypothetical protein
VSCVLSSPDPRQAFPGPPAFPLEWRFPARARSLSESGRLTASSMSSVGSGQRLWMSIAGSSSGDV